jgi:hypothetical protein
VCATQLRPHLVALVDKGLINHEKYKNHDYEVVDNVHGT